MLLIIFSFKIHYEVVECSLLIRSTILARHKMLNLLEALYYGYIYELRLAIANGADVNARHQNGKTPLMIALLGRTNKKKKNYVVKLLLQAGANPNIKDDDFNSVLHIAVMASTSGKFVSRKIIQILLDFNADYTTVNKNGKTACEIAFELKNVKIGHLLLFHALESRDRGNLAIHYDSFYGRIDALKKILSTEGNKTINQQNKDGLTPLMMALLSNKGKTNKSEVIDILLQCGADVNLTNKNADSTLHVAVKASMRKVISTKFISQLLDYGADHNMLDKNDKTPSQLAFDLGNTKLGDFLLFYVSKESKDFDVYRIHYAAYYGRADILKTLIEDGDDVNVQNKEGKTPLMLALRGSAGKQKKLETVLTLLNNGADVNMINKDGDSTLHVAAKASKYRIVQKELVRKLLLYGADNSMLNREGKTASQLAFESKNVKLGTFLLFYDRDKRITGKFISAPIQKHEFNKIKNGTSANIPIPSNSKHPDCIIGNISPEFNEKPTKCRSFKDYNYDLDSVDCKGKENRNSEANTNFIEPQNVKEHRIGGENHLRPRSNIDDNPNRKSYLYQNMVPDYLSDMLICLPKGLKMGYDNFHQDKEKNCAQLEGHSSQFHEEANKMYRANSLDLIEEEKTGIAEVYINENLPFTERNTPFTDVTNNDLLSSTEFDAVLSDYDTPRPRDHFENVQDDDDAHSVIYHYDTPRPFNSDSPHADDGSSEEYAESF